jgi:hypothetical protein
MWRVVVTLATADTVNLRYKEHAWNRQIMFVIVVIRNDHSEMIIQV